MTFAEKLKEVRIKKGYTQKRLGELCDPQIAESTIRRYELGKLNPKLETKQKIAAALGVSLFELETFGEDLPDGSVVTWGEDGDATTFFGKGNKVIDSVKLLFQLLFTNKLRKELDQVIDEIDKEVEESKKEVETSKKFCEELERLEQSDSYKKAKKLMTTYSQLNDEGQDKVISYAEDIASNEKYRASDEDVSFKSQTPEEADNGSD